MRTSESRDKAVSFSSRRSVPAGLRKKFQSFRIWDGKILTERLQAFIAPDFTRAGTGPEFEPVLT